MSGTVWTHERLTADVEVSCDVCIVGAGVVGTEISSVATLLIRNR